MIFEICNDLKFGLRFCFRNLSSTLLAVLVFALGTSIAAILYSVSSAMLVGSSGVELSERVLSVDCVYENGRGQGVPLSVFSEMEQSNKAFDQLIGIEQKQLRFNLPLKENEGVYYAGVIGTGNFFELVDDRFDR